MTGGRVFDQSLAALAPLGRLAVFGMASRTAADPGRPAQADGAQPGGDRVLAGARRAAALAARRGGHRPAGVFADGSLRAVVGGTYPLDRAADAHRALLDRSSVGKLVLDPQA